MQETEKGALPALADTEFFPNSSTVGTGVDMITERAMCLLYENSAALPDFRNRCLHRTRGCALDSQVQGLPPWVIIRSGMAAMAADAMSTRKIAPRTFTNLLFTCFPITFESAAVRRIG